MTIAYCFRSGEIEFGEAVPEGAIEILRGEHAVVERVITTLARHAYDGKTLLVPGLPEARDDEAAVHALDEFIVWATGRLDTSKSWGGDDPEP